MAQAEIKAVITARDEASSVVSKFGDGVSHVGRNVALGIGIAGAAVAAFGALAVSEFSASEDAATQLNSVLQSTGGVAGVTAAQAQKLASSLQSVTKFSDETILGGENLLLTFTNIGKDVFPRATEAMVDMSQALGQDVKQSAIQLGKALQAPTLGMAALSRTGALNKDDMERLAKQWEQRNTPLAQQQVELLQALEKEFKGSAKAAGTTLSGQLEILKNSFSDVMEVVGGGIASVIKPAISAFNKWFQAMGGAEGVLDSLKRSWEIVIQGFTTGGDVFGQGENSPFNIFLLTIHDSLVALANVFNTYIKPALDQLWATIQTQLLPALQEFWDKNQNWIIPALKEFGILLAGTIVVAILAVIYAINGIVYAISQVITFLGNLQQWFSTAIDAIKTKVTDLKDHFWENVGFIIGFFALLPAKLLFYVFVALQGVLNYLIRIDWGSVFDRLGRAWSNIWNSIPGMAMNAFNFIRNIDWAGVVNGVNKGIVNGIAGLLEGVLNGAMAGLPGAPKVHFPRFAKGVENFGGGMAIVGERGPELVNLPRGSDVIPNNRISSGSNTTININVGLMTGSAIERREAAAKMFEDLKDIASQRGQTVSQMIGAV